MADADPVGMTEIAARAGVRLGTVMQWRDRHPQDHAHPWPPARWQVGGRDAWDWGLDIAPWLEATGRQPRKPRVWTLEADVSAGALQQCVIDAGGPAYGVGDGRYATVTALGDQAPAWMQRAAADLAAANIDHNIS